MYENCKRLVRTPASNSTWKRRNLNGEISSSISINFDDWLQECREVRISLLWYEIQTQLCQRLSSEKIKVNMRCINVKQLTTLLQDNLENKQAIDRVFQTYENERRPLMEKMQTVTLNRHRWTQADWTKMDNKFIPVTLP